MHLLAIHDAIKVTLNERVGLLKVWERGLQVILPPPYKELPWHVPGWNACIREMNRGFHVDPQSGCAPCGSVPVREMELRLVPSESLFSWN